MRSPRDMSPSISVIAQRVSLRARLSRKSVAHAWGPWKRFAYFRRRLSLPDRTQDVVQAAILETLEDCAKFMGHMQRMATSSTAVGICRRVDPESR